MTTTTQRFQYGGHASFPVRYGWLHKGVSRLVEQGAFAANLETADDLGLGSKMVESLSFWLTATGMAEADRGILSPTRLAHLIHDNDRYFERPGTWWFMHLLLTEREGTVWSWFFQDYADRIFDRLGCVDAFLQFAARKAVRAPTTGTAQRDVTCLLSAYAARPGVDTVDPDEIGACPLRELGLLTRHEAVNRFEKVRRATDVPLEVFLASAARLAEITGKQSLSARELATLRGGPGRALCLDTEGVEALINRVGRSWWTRGIQAQSLNGERHLQIPEEPPETWLAMFYERVVDGADR